MNNLNARHKKILNDYVAKYENELGLGCDNLNQKSIIELKKIHDYATLRLDAEKYVKDRLEKLINFYESDSFVDLERWVSRKAYALVKKETEKYLDSH